MAKSLLLSSSAGMLAAMPEASWAQASRAHLGTASFAQALQCQEPVWGAKEAHREITPGRKSACATAHPH